MVKAFRDALGEASVPFVGDVVWSTEENAEGTNGRIIVIVINLK